MFFFQAEDGIRDLVRSRGLGDVYKRQPKAAKKTFIIIGGSDAFLLMGLVLMWLLSPATGWSLNNPQIPLQGEFAPVSYTHLTLPTSDLV